MTESTINKEENSASQMRKGLLEFCTLLIISRGEVYASDILNELKGADLLVVEGTLYPLLSRLRSDGYLSYRWEESESGPPRKYYSLTEKGKTTLIRLKSTWKTLAGSINALLK
jgi:PadR family transcriptional regulator PadR